MILLKSKAIVSLWLILLLVVHLANGQDLSVAGRRAGLAGERSGLYMEQIRLIKEMRNESKRQLSMRGADDSSRYLRPRYMVWENVKGAFSSNKGEDFRCVLEEAAKVVDEDAVIPMPEKGKWQTSGLIMGDGWSIAWRVHDAQFWGVPQRRQRVCMVCDFNGYTAGDIVFDVRSMGEADYRNAFEAESDIGEEPRPEVQPISESVSGDTEQSEQEGEATPAAAGENADTTGTISFQERAGKPGGGKGILIQHERTGALSTLNIQSVLSEPLGCTE